MAISRNFNGATIFLPGAYSRTEVNLAGGFPIAPTGIVALVGEAEGGAPGSTDGVQTFTSQDIRALVEKYKSGPIVNAARLLIAPARDTRVPNGASLIRVFKTNASLASALALSNGSTTLFNLSSKNFGEDENLIKVTVSAGTGANNRLVKVVKQGTTEDLSENAADVWLDIEYTGALAAADLTIQAGVLAVATTGSAEDISITLAGKTVQDVVDLINADANYTATTSFTRASFAPATDLDPISTPTDVGSGAVDLLAVQKELLDIINGESSLISAARVADVEGNLALVGPAFMTGAAKGASTNTNFQSGFDALLALRCNIVVPLISRDASVLVPLGLTDPSSTFTVDAVNLQAATHCVTASNTKNRSERNCYVSKKDTFASSQTAAQSLNEARASMLFQDVEVVGSTGDLVTEDPWAASAILAGIQAGTDIGTPATFKGINVNSISHQDYNERTQAELAIASGLLPLQSRDSGGFRVAVHNSTYNNDANFVFNRPSVLEAADTVAFNLRQQLEAIFVGTKAATGTAEAIRNTTIGILSTFLNADIIVGDDTNDNLGWKDLTVTITGNTANIDVTITPVQGVDFILATITLDDIRQSA